MSQNPNYLQVPGGVGSMDGPSDTRSHPGGSRGGGSQPRSQPGSVQGGSQRGSPPDGSPRHQGSPRTGPPSGSGRSPSQHPSPSGSQAGGSRSRTGSSVAGSIGHGGMPPHQPYPVAQAGPPLTEDEKDDEFRKALPTRIDLPPEAFMRNFHGSPFATRPGFNTKGKDIAVRVNQYRVEGIPSTGRIWQYDVVVTPVSPTGREINMDRVSKKCWTSQAVQTRLARYPNKFLYDGRKLAWSMADVPEGFRMEIDLDKENGRTGGSGRNRFYLSVTRTHKINLMSLRAYLDGNAEWDNHVLESLTFFDHIMRQGPSERMIAIKRNFYAKDAPRSNFDLMVYATKGIYASLRMNQSIKEGGSGLGVNVDVANTVFWQSKPLPEMMRDFLHCIDPRYESQNFPELMTILQPVEYIDKDTGKRHWVKSEPFRLLKRFAKLQFEVIIRGRPDTKKTYAIKNFMFDPKYGRDGCHARTFTFTKKKTGEQLTVADHLLKAYNIRLSHPRLPLVDTARDGQYPPEVCKLLDWQRYNFKLNPKQTSDMIKFAVTRPQTRAGHIKANIDQLGWGKDPYLREVGLKINENMTLVKAKLLQNPEVQYGNGKINPGVSGRWDLRGRTFIQNNAIPLNSWGFAVLNGSVDAPALNNFIKVFADTYKKHGGKIGKPPTIYNLGPRAEVHFVVEDMYKKLMIAANGAPPDLCFFVLLDKNQFIYNRIKKNMECRWGMVSQCLNHMHVKKASPQYCSNVAMKVNCKLGGQTCRVAGGPQGQRMSPFFAAPTMLMGADVSHGGHNLDGEPEPSIAAMTFSMDKDAARYAASVQTNGYRVEIISPLNIKQMMPHVLHKWKAGMNGAAPQHVFYFRDGVAEGQFAQVLDYELGTIRDIFQEELGVKPKITVIVATKRHHIRFFPDKGPNGDKNGNALPGTLVEREVTHPYYYDFYLCSHVAIQGTARPVHYHVIHDEVKMPTEQLQQMIYAQCYQYQRATTPVSLHPAVYYAHLASARARAHINEPSSNKDPKAKKVEGFLAKGVKEGAAPHRRATESIPLLPMGSQAGHERNKAHTKHTMWYI